MNRPHAYGLPTDADAASSRGRRAAWYLAFMAVLALCACAWATQRIAEGYGYHAGLGGALWGRIYAPWMCFLWENRLRDAYGIIENALLQAQCIFFVPQAVVIFCLLLFGRSPRGTANIHGSARWATYDEIAAMGLLNGYGVYLGSYVRTLEGGEKWLRRLQGQSCRQQWYLRHNGPEHILAFMPTRSGKGVGLILPTLLSWSESSVVFDIKGENWALTSGYLKSRGHVCLRFDPADPTGASVRYNPLEEVRLREAHAISDAQNIITMLLDPNGKGFEGKDAHWKKNAVALLSGVLLHCMILTLKQHQRTANLRDLAYMFGNQQQSEQQMFEEMLKTKHAEILDELFGKGNHRGTDIQMFIAAAARNILGKPEGERGSVISTATTDLALYKDPVVAENCAVSDFRISDLMHHENPVHLYLVVSPGDMNRLRPLVRIIITQIIHKMTTKMEFENGASKANYKHRLLFMMDELPALGKIDILETAIAYIAGYGGKFYLIVQDMQQLNGVYGKENAIMANCHIRIGAAPNTPEAGKFLSELTGKTTVVETKTSLSGSRSGILKNANVSVQEVARPLLTPDECMRLPAARKDSEGRIVAPGNILVFVAGSNPILGWQMLYFKDPVFMARAKIPAPEVSDRLPGEKTLPVAAAAPEESLYEKHLRAL